MKESLNLNRVDIFDFWEVKTPFSIDFHATRITNSLTEMFRSNIDTFSKLKQIIINTGRTVFTSDRTQEGIESVVNALLLKFKDDYGFDPSTDNLTSETLTLVLLQWHSSQVKTLNLFAQSLGPAFKNPNRELTLVWREEGAKTTILANDVRWRQEIGLTPRSGPYDLLFDFTASCGRYPFKEMNNLMSTEGMQPFRNGLAEGKAGERKIIWKVVNAVFNDLNMDNTAKQQDPKYFNPKNAAFHKERGNLDRYTRIFTNEAVKKGIIQYIEEQHLSPMSLMAEMRTLVKEKICENSETSIDEVRTIFASLDNSVYAWFVDALHTKLFKVREEMTDHAKRGVTIMIHERMKEFASKDWLELIDNFRTNYCTYFCTKCTCATDLDYHEASAGWRSSGCTVCCNECLNDIKTNIDDVLWFTLESDLTLDIKTRRGVIDSFTIALQIAHNEGHFSVPENVIQEALTWLSNPFYTMKQEEDVYVDFIGARYDVWEPEGKDITIVFMFCNCTRGFHYIHDLRGSTNDKYRLKTNIQKNGTTVEQKTDITWVKNTEFLDRKIPEGDLNGCVQFVDESDHEVVFHTRFINNTRGRHDIWFSDAAQRNTTIK